MRNFNIMAAVAVALLAGGVAAAQEKPAKSKEKKICRVEQDSGSRLVGSRRICRTIGKPSQVLAKPQHNAARPAEASGQTN